MINEKRILSYFIGWLIVGFIIIFIGVNNVFAQTTSTYQDIGYLNDVTILYSLSEDPPNPVEIPRNNEYQLENVFKFIIEIENYTFNAGTTYAIELSIPETKINNNFYSVIASDGTSCSIGSTDNTNSPYPTFIFNCPKNTNSLTLNIYNSDNSYVLNSGIFRWNYIFLRKQITTTDTSILENQQSQMIEQNQQIIQGQEEIKDTIKDQLNDCSTYEKKFTKYKNGFLNGLPGTETENNGYMITNYIKIEANKTYTFDIISNNNMGIKYGSYCLYDKDKNVINCNLLNSEGTTYTFTSTNETYYFRTTLYNNSNVLNNAYISGYFCSNKLDEAEETRKGIWETIKDLPNMFLDMLLGLFIPDDLSFINEFKEVISNKLGFIASIPIQIIDFSLGLVDVVFEEITTISFPSVSIFGFNFWNAEEIDITIMLDKLKPFRYFTDFTCVILCCRTLYDLYHKFTGGGAS